MATATVTPSTNSCAEKEPFGTLTSPLATMLGPSSETADLEELLIIKKPVIRAAETTRTREEITIIIIREIIITTITIIKAKVAHQEVPARNAHRKVSTHIPETVKNLFAA